MSKKTVERESLSPRILWGPDAVIQRVRPVETFKYLGNPHKGTTTFQRFNGDPLFPGLMWNDKDGPTEFPEWNGNSKNPRYPDTTLSYCRWIWAVIEPEKGKFRWDILDGALKAARLRGQTLQMRIQPYVGDSMPAWYWALGGKKQTPPWREGSVDPDHNDPLYLKHWGGFIKEFGKRYDGHPAIESVDAAYGGSCGECGGNSSDETAEKLMDVYLKAFKKTHLVLMIGTHGCTYAAKMDRPLGWRGDCYGDMRTLSKTTVPDGLNWKHMFDEYPMVLFTNGVQDHWRTAPVTLETCWTVGHWYKEGWDIDWIIEHGYKYHLSVFMPKSSYIPEAWTDKIDAFNRRMGYRLVLRQMTLPIEAARGKTAQFQLWIDNVGVAPLYRPYSLAYRFRQGKKSAIVHSKQDVRKWLPEYTWFSEKVSVPKSLSAGLAHVDIAIVDPATDTPRVKLAIEEILDDGWHPMSAVEVT